MKNLVIGFMSLVGTLAVAGTANADYTIRSLLTGKCLGVSGGSGVAGTSVVTFTCDGTLNQRWATGAFWPSPNNMFTHILNRVNGATSTNRSLGLSNSISAVNASCNNNTTDTDDKGWWVDYAGDFAVPGLAGLQHCYSFKSKINTSTVLTTSTGQNNVQPTRSALSGSLTNGQIWCIVDI
ncbi:RICIN domain-containing protein [Sorangium sp. So ce131]|uniref:RICIN domain-containing protein n=1 Tax=Sorangium sp. So ce131 TaxID=3133282 RepID=UPI003F5FECD5